MLWFGRMAITTILQLALALTVIICGTAIAQSDLNIIISVSEDVIGMGRSVLVTITPSNADPQVAYRFWPFVNSTQW